MLTCLTSNCDKATCDGELALMVTGEQAGADDSDMTMVL